MESVWREESLAQVEEKKAAKKSGKANEGPKAGQCGRSREEDFKKDDMEKGAPKVSVMRLGLFTGFSDMMAMGQRRLCASVMEARIQWVCVLDSNWKWSSH